jgi:hypothetical protein
MAGMAGARARGVPADLAARARAVGGQWKLLAVAHAWCSDAVSAVVFLAALADRSRGWSFGSSPPKATITCSRATS